MGREERRPEVELRVRPGSAEPGGGVGETWELEKAEQATPSFGNACGLLGFVLHWHSECCRITLLVLLWSGEF